MKVLLLNGSPHRDGCTAVALKEMIRIFEAEGVETEQQFEDLRDAGCRMFQGYYFAKPMPEAEFEKYLSGETEQ